MDTAINCQLLLLHVVGAILLAINSWLNSCRLLVQHPDESSGRKVETKEVCLRQHIHELVNSADI